MLIGVKLRGNPLGTKIALDPSPVHTGELPLEIGRMNQVRSSFWAEKPALRWQAQVSLCDSIENATGRLCRNLCFGGRLLEKLHTCGLSCRHPANQQVWPALSPNSWTRPPLNLRETAVQGQVIARECYDTEGAVAPVWFSFLCLVYASLRCSRLSHTLSIQIGFGKTLLAKTTASLF